MNASDSSDCMRSSFFCALRRETLLEKGLLGPVASERECPQLGCSALLTLAKFKQEFSTDGMEEVIRNLANEQYRA